MDIDQEENVRFLRILISLVPAYLLACAPNRIAFTQDLRDSLRFSSEELKQLQYYVDGEILLRRTLMSADRSVVRGRLVTEEGRLIHEVLVKSGTPGLVLQVPSNRDIQVSFAEGTQLPFTSARYRPARYCLKRHNWDSDSPTDDVDFEGQTYSFVFGNRRYACLLISRKSLLELEKRRRVLPGRRIP